MSLRLFPSMCGSSDQGPDAKNQRYFLFVANEDTIIALTYSNLSPDCLRKNLRYVVSFGQLTSFPQTIRTYVKDNNIVFFVFRPTVPAFSSSRSMVW